ncbi:hypothetical protein FF38_04081 [Lucilia cuprina]|uniref:Uncharacterized protein n=1 Tax=Lucilia cuprina TaxID=7375 RepID=A0A0L0BU84_LUCCU|nr:hypothetical protein FF38_04081 [Lucilia cuprina]
MTLRTRDNGTISIGNNSLIVASDSNSRAGAIAGLINMRASAESFNFGLSGCIYGTAAGNINLTASSIASIGGTIGTASVIRASVHGHCVSGNNSTISLDYRNVGIFKSTFSTALMGFGNISVHNNGLTIDHLNLSGIICFHLKLPSLNFEKKNEVNKSRKVKKTIEKCKQLQLYSARILITVSHTETAGYLYNTNTKPPGMLGFALKGSVSIYDPLRNESADSFLAYENLFMSLA